MLQITSTTGSCAIAQQRRCSSEVRLDIAPPEITTPPSYPRSLSPYSRLAEPQYQTDVSFEESPVKQSSYQSPPAYSEPPFVPYPQEQLQYPAWTVEQDSASSDHWYTPERRHEYFDAPGYSYGHMGQHRHMFQCPWIRSITSTFNLFKLFYCDWAVLTITFLHNFTKIYCLSKINPISVFDFCV